MYGRVHALPAQLSAVNERLHDPFSSCLMRTLLVAFDPADAQSVARRIHEQIGHSGPARVLTVDAATTLVKGEDGVSLTVVFFCGRKFCNDELRAIKHLSLLQPERAKLIAVGNGNCPERILETIRCGAIDYLDTEREFDNALQAVLDRIQTLERHEKKLGRLLGIVSPVGGAGTSTLACNLAAILASRNGGCGLIDLHPRGGDLAGLLNLEPRHSLGSIAVKSQQLDAAMFEQSLTAHESGIRLLAGPEPFADYRQITVEATQRILQFARERFAYVVADLEDVEHAEQIRTLAACERIIIVLRADFIAVSRCKRWLEYLNRAKIPREHISIAVNRTGQAKELPLDFLRKALGDGLQCCIPNDPETVQEAYNLGSPFVLTSPSAEASVGLKNFVADLLGEPREKEQGTRATTWLSALCSLPSRLNAVTLPADSQSIPLTRSANV